jgi:hypothetical protein
MRLGCDRSAHQPKAMIASTAWPSSPALACLSLLRMLPEREGDARMPSDKPAGATEGLASGANPTYTIIGWVDF